MDDIDQISATLGLPVEEGSIMSIDGAVRSWRIVSDVSDDSLPFFIAYDGDQDMRLRRWQDRVREAGNEGFGNFTFVEVGGDPERMRAVLADAELAVRFVSGRPGLHAIGISGPNRELVLRDTA